MPLPNLSPEVRSMRLHLRHIHIPDLPPLYAPRVLAPRIRDFIQDQIKRMRALSEESDTLENHVTGGSHEDTPRTAFGRPPPAFKSWVKHASPPPTVLSFTRRPTYILPKHKINKTEQWQVDFLQTALKSKMKVNFPKPPRWSSLPWRPFWEHKQPENEWIHDPLSHEWPNSTVMIMPCAEAMYLGPGQVSMWPIIDLKDDVQRGNRRFRTKYEYERVLEDTTIAVLKREYNIDAFAIPGSAGVWVESRIPPPEIDLGQVDRDDGIPAGSRRENVRRIATIHSSITENITQWGVSIHVGQPDPFVDSWPGFMNPWTPIRQHRNTTSVVAELAYIGTSPRYESRTRQLALYGREKTRYLQTYFNRDFVFAGALYKSMPYGLVKTQAGRREPAPLGLDNRDLSTAWTYEFASQLGMHDGFVDHYGVVDFPDATSTDLPTKMPKPGFMARPILDERWLTQPYEQVDVPSVQLGNNELVSPKIMEETLAVEKADGKLDSGGHDGWMISWPLWYDTLTRKLDESIAGGPWDTRLRTYEWDKEQAVRHMRRKAALREAEELQWDSTATPKQPAQHPLTDRMIEELTERVGHIEQVLQEGSVGRKLSQGLLESTAQIRRLLESRFPSPVPDSNEVKQRLAAADLFPDWEDEVEARQPHDVPHDVQHDAHSFTELLTSKSPDVLAIQEDVRTPREAVRREQHRRVHTRPGGPEKDGRNDTNSMDKPKISSTGRRTGHVEFSETGPQKFHRERRARGIENARARRKGTPDAVSARPATPGGRPTFLPRTHQLLSSDPD